MAPRSAPGASKVIIFLAPAELPVSSTTLHTVQKGGRFITASSVELKLVGE